MTPTLPETTTDAELLQRYALESDQTAFTELYRRYEALIRGSCHRRLPPALVDDAVQAVALTLALKAGSLIRHDRLAAWLHTVSGHVCQRLQASETARRRRERQIVQPVRLSSVETIPPHFDAALARLPVSDRDLLLRHHGLDQSCAELSDALAISPAAVAMRLSRARARLRRSLAHEGVTVGTSVLAGLGGTALAAEPSHGLAIPQLSSAAASPLVQAALAGLRRAVWKACLLPAAASLLLVLGVIGITAADSVGEVPGPRPQTVDDSVPQVAVSPPHWIRPQLGLSPTAFDPETPIDVDLRGTTLGEALQRLAAELDVSIILADPDPSLMDLPSHLRRERDTWRHVLRRLATDQQLQAYRALPRQYVVEANTTPRFLAVNIPNGTRFKDFLQYLHEHSERGERFGLDPRIAHLTTPELAVGNVAPASALGMGAGKGGSQLAYQAETGWSLEAAPAPRVLPVPEHFLMQGPATEAADALAIGHWSVDDMPRLQHLLQHTDKALLPLPRLADARLDSLWQRLLAAWRPSQAASLPNYLHWHSPALGAADSAYPSAITYDAEFAILTLTVDVWRQEGANNVAAPRFEEALIALPKDLPAGAWRLRLIERQYQQDGNVFLPATVSWGELAVTAPPSRGALRLQRQELATAWVADDWRAAQPGRLPLSGRGLPPRQLADLPEEWTLSASAGLWRDGIIQPCDDPALPRHALIIGPALDGVDLAAPLALQVDAEHLHCTLAWWDRPTAAAAADMPPRVQAWLIDLPPRAASLPKVLVELQRSPLAGDDRQSDEMHSFKLLIGDQAGGGSIEIQLPAAEEAEAAAVGKPANRASSAKRSKPIDGPEGF